MTEAQKQEIYREALDCYGPGKQIIKAVEEMSELQKELCKCLIGKKNLDHIAEEIADVAIMLDQMEAIFGVNEAVDDYIVRKLHRLNGRILEESV